MVIEKEYKIKNPYKDLESGATRVFPPKSGREKRRERRKSERRRK